jgi:hypothetical protein
MNNRVGKPWSVQVEFTEGCTRYCTFCGLQGIRSGPGDFKFMTQAVAERVAHTCANLVPKARYEFAMHGEPLANPNHLQLVRTFRRALPHAQLMLTTNGSALRRRMRTRVRKLLEAGLDYLVLDTYYPERDYLRDEAQLLPFTVWDFYDDCVPRGWSPWANHKRSRTGPHVVLMDDLAARTGDHTSRVISNHAGSAGPAPPQPLCKVCTIPFREVSVRWDGKVALCCNDWPGRLMCGDLIRQSLTEVWWGRQFEAARAVLSTRCRDFLPCRKCDQRPGPRVGLLPKYDEPTNDQLRLLGVNSHGPEKAS